LINFADEVEEYKNEAIEQPVDNLPIDLHAGLYVDPNPVQIGGVGLTGLLSGVVLQKGVAEIFGSWRWQIMPGE
jgi:hypothetical protein